jgi:copper transport protein
VSVVADAVHLGAIALWLGGLIMLFGFLLRQTDEREQTAILPVWSRWAGLAISAVILAGVVGALIEIGTFTALFGTTYGKLMLVKVGLVALILCAAAVARKSVQSGQGLKVRKFVTIELTVATLVLGVTAALTQTTPARTAEAIAQTPPAPVIYTVTLNSSLYKLTVEIDPAKSGNNLVHTYAYDKNGQPLKVVEWKVTAALPSAAVEPIDVPVLKITDNHASGAITLPTPGAWVFSFTLRISDFDQDTVSATVPVK